MLDSVELQTTLLPPRASSNGTLRRIYEEALVRFAERGYHGVSIREIAEACGIKASSVYAHLPSKERLLYDLTVIAHEEHRDGLRNALLESGSDPADQLRTLVIAHVRFHADYPILATVGNHELHALSESSASAIQDIRDEATRLFVDVIERGVRLEKFDCEDPALATAAIAAMGIRLAAWYRPETARAEMAADQYPMRVWKLFADLGRNYSAQEIAERYAEFALKLVS